MSEKLYRAWAETKAEAGVDVAAVRSKLGDLVLETPSWGYGNSGTRFKVFPHPGVPRNPNEKLEDAAQVHKLTGICPRIALHIPWDKVDDWAALKRRAGELGLTLGAVNPNLFQDEAYKLGSVTHHDPAVRRKAVRHLLECVEIGRIIGSDLQSIWLADGTNYPGQADMRRRRAWMEESLGEAYRAMPKGMKMLIEYKFFEPAWYHTDLPDWGTAASVCRNLGEQAQVLVDTGHHPQGTNIPHVVANLIYEGRLGGFHFNDRKYADDDLIAGSVNPYELFLIFCELISADAIGRTAFMIDQSFCIESKLEGMLRTVVNIHQAYAKALLVDWAALGRAQEAGDILGAEAVLRAAYDEDVRPLLADWRRARNLPEDPVAAFRRSDYQTRINRDRVGAGAGWSA
ncbi:MAG TPA: L-rhamnose isomerase [Limnochordia bacterium]|nr:L-rhamnose isomerase [Limnochordia bacterium]